MTESRSSYTIHPDLNLLFVRFAGNVTISQHRALIQTVRDDPRNCPSLARFCDSALMSDTEVGVSTLLAYRDDLHRRYRDQPGPIPWALYAPTEFSFGMARMWETLLSDVPALQPRIFTCPNAALASVGLDRPGMMERLGLEPADRCA